MMNAFAALSDETRREIVRLVAEAGEMASTDISRNFSISAPAISQHLKVLKQANVLSVRKDAQRRIYSLNSRGIEEVDDWLLEIKTLWRKRLDRLEKYALKLKKDKARGRKKR